jgi:hypothetical protein
VTGHDPRQDFDDEPWRGHLAPEAMVRLPAAMMWVFGLLQFIITQLWIVFFAGLLLFAHFVDEKKTIGELWTLIKSDEEIWLGLAVWPVATACTIVVVRGANGLRNFRRYWWVVTGAILTVLAVPFFYLGVVQLPLGIWLLVLLARRDVRARFAVVARGTMTQAPPEAPDARAD